AVAEVAGEHHEIRPLVVEDALDKRSRACVLCRAVAEMRVGDLRDLEAAVAKAQRRSHAARLAREPAPAGRNGILRYHRRRAMDSVIVTGGAGFIGSNFARRALRNG